MNNIEKTRQELLKKGKKIINLSSGNPNEHGIYFPQAILQKGFDEFLKNPKYEPDPKGLLKARKAVQSFYKKRGLTLDPEQIILTSGSSESYLHLFKLLVKPGQKILFPKPSYPLFEEIARIAGIEISFYELDENADWQIDFEKLEKQIDPQVKAIVLISPNNPTGSVLTKNSLSGVIKVAQKNNISIISDEVFSEFIFKNFTEGFTSVAKLSQQVNIFTINGISKTYALPGLKLSWIAATGPNQKENIEQLERYSDALLACNQISQSLLPEIMKQGAKFIKSFCTQVEKNKNLAVEILKKSPKITFHEPDGGFYLFAKINPRNQKITDEQFVIEFLKATNIFAHPGYFYDYDAEIYVLISLLLPAKILKKSLESIVKFTENRF